SPTAIMAIGIATAPQPNRLDRKLLIASVNWPLVDDRALKNKASEPRISTTPRMSSLLSSDSPSLSTLGALLARAFGAGLVAAPAFRNGRKRAVPVAPPDLPPLLAAGAAGLAAAPPLLKLPNSGFLAAPAPDDDVEADAGLAADELLDPPKRDVDELLADEPEAGFLSSPLPTPGKREVKP